MENNKIINAPKSNAFPPYGVNDKPFDVGVLLFNDMECINYLGYKVCDNGDVYSKQDNKRLLKYHIDKDGYFRIAICNKNHVRCVGIARLIAELFIPNPENKPQVNHKNGIKSDNRLENLEWVTSKENIKHSYKMGLVKFVRPVYQYTLDGKFIDKHESMTAAQRNTGVHEPSICNCANGKTSQAGGFIWIKA